MVVVCCCLRRRHGPSPECSDATNLPSGDVGRGRRQAEAALTESPMGRAIGRRGRSDALCHRALVPVAFLLLALNLTPRSAEAADRCPGAETTLALLECLGRRLEQTDRALANTLNGVAASAHREPGGTFLPLWQQFSEGLISGGDPARQLRAFQRERRQICQYINAMSLQGSGFGVFVLSCELDLSDAILQQLRN